MRVGRANRILAATSYGAVVNPDVYTAAHTLRHRNAFTHDDGTPLNYTLVNTANWCKNTYEVVSQLRININYSHHRYNCLLLINGVPVAQIELKTLSIDPRRAVEQIVEYKSLPRQRLHVRLQLLCVPSPTCRVSWT